MPVVRFDGADAHVESGGHRVKIAKLRLDARPDSIRLRIWSPGRETIDVQLDAFEVEVPPLKSQPSPSKLSKAKSSRRRLRRLLGRQPGA